MWGTYLYTAAALEFALRKEKEDHKNQLKKQEEQWKKNDQKWENYETQRKEDEEKNRRCYNALGKLECVSFIQFICITVEL